MAKRKNQNRDNRDQKFKKFKLSSGIVEPGQYGIYATCTKGREAQCIKELKLAFGEKIEEYYHADLLAMTEGNDNVEEDGNEDVKKELLIEDQIKKELLELKANNDDKKKSNALIKETKLGCECLIFLQCKKPIVPSEFCHRYCQEAFDSKIKTTRYTQRLSPIDSSCSASLEEVIKLSKKILKPHFQAEKDQKPLKFAIQINRRNFSALEKMDIIKAVAGCVGTEHGHSVDLKNYDKLILIECFKTNVGMSVLDDYDRLCKYNLQQIFDKSHELEEGKSEN
ncbi:hypothetical protein PACTADRAFT_3797 [Pachysolen tannophilus NRRL Y-2460]|uniref:THUMP domain-containing protein n=1 Tax=Pachysolen tannophilus NRRL Y-2460 TaxID=669874 RepID=A0A1E4TT35_PACTA|nr:hypothetical protein PACTADRAFT_3797 [Pachysolen tannophilus NRRL Y-2460]